MPTEVPIAQPIIGEEEKAAVIGVLESGNVAQGEKVAEFEAAFAEYVGAKHAVAVSSGTAAIHLSLLAHGAKNGTEVITTPFSFISTANSILHCGARAVFADVETSSFNLDPKAVKELITPFTRVVMPVHLYGNPANLDAFKRLANWHGLAIVEDACQAHGAIYKGQKIGSFNTTCFSFYPSKNMTTAEGGMVTTNNESIAWNVRNMRQHGVSGKQVGFNYRMTDIQAAVGIEQLKKLDGFNEARRKNAELLTEGLSEIVMCPVEAEGSTHCWHQYTIRVTKQRQAILTALHEAGINARVYYETPINLMSPYSGNLKHMPRAEKLAKHVISLPVHPGVTEENIAKMVEVITCALA